MNTTYIKSLASLAVAIAVTSVASAIPITGGIAFTSVGGLGYPLGQLDATNPTLTIQNEFVTSTSGPGTTFNSVPVFTGGITFANVNLTGTGPDFTAASVVGPVLWSFTSGGETYSFDATSASIAEITTGWVIGGNGFFTGTGAINYTDTFGTYHVTLSGDGSVDQVGATSAANLPDNATTALLVGLGLVGMGFYASRKQVKA
jgi:hypothetical protein